MYSNNRELRPLVKKRMNKKCHTTLAGDNESCETSSQQCVNSTDTQNRGKAACIFLHEVHLWWWLITMLVWFSLTLIQRDGGRESAREGAPKISVPCADIDTETAEAVVGMTFCTFPCLPLLRTTWKNKWISRWSAVGPAPYWSRQIQQMDWLDWQKKTWGISVYCVPCLMFHTVGWNITSGKKNQIPAIASSAVIISLLFGFLWFQVQFCLDQVITNRTGRGYICLAFSKVGPSVKYWVS